MTDFTAKNFADDLTEAEQNAIVTLIAEGKYARAKTTVKVAASDRDMIITDDEAQRVVDVFRPDGTAEEITLSQFPNKEDKPAMGMEITDNITDPQHRNPPNANNV